MSGAWHVVGASVRGTSHLKTMTPCQDSCAYMVMESGTLLAAVSDGAGSAARSDLGSQQAVNQTLEILFAELLDRRPANHRTWGDLLFETFCETRRRVLRLTAEEGGQPRDYACTLTILIADDDWLVSGQIGDGYAAVQTTREDLVAIAEPQRGEYADSTYFITDEQAADVFVGRVYRQGLDIGPVRSLAAMTDGLTNLAIDRRSAQPHRPFFKPLMQVPGKIRDHETALTELYEFLVSDRINARTDDDKTLVLAGRPGR
jgi:serine/threonine protein phosphatase PrpC